MFGNGSDGPITFSSNTTFNPPADAVVNSASSGGTTLTLSSVSGVFQAGQKILIHQTRGTGAGLWELNTVQSYALGNKVTVTPLAHTYTTSGANAAQVLVVPQYTNVTVNAGVTVSAKPWNGSVGGILAFLASGTTTVDGSLAASGGGYRGGAAGVDANSFQGEGTPGVGVQSSNANGNGGGGANGATPLAGGGGGNGSPGSPSSENGNPGASGGLAAGTSDLTTAVFGGGGGGSAGSSSNCGGGRPGGNGGAIFRVSSANITMGSGGQVRADGNDGDGSGEHGSGAGAGGSILLRTQSGNFGSATIRAVGGLGGLDHGCTGGNSENGGNGGDGRIRVEYCTSISGGIANPPASVAQISCGSKTPTPTPVPVGGIASLPDVATLPQTATTSGDNGSIVAGLAAILAVTVAMGVAVWYARKRRVS